MLVRILCVSLIYLPCVEESFICSCSQSTVEHYRAYCGILYVLHYFIGIVVHNVSVSVLCVGGSRHGGRIGAGEAAEEGSQEEEEEEAHNAGRELCVGEVCVCVLGDM